MEYWSWWLGAIALGLFAVVFSFLTGKPLGVSGSWLSIARRRDDAVLKESAEVFAGDQKEVTDDLMAMTLAEFGESALNEIEDTPAAASKEPQQDVSDTRQSFTPWTAHAVFLVTMFFGSYLASLVSGDFSLSYELSSLHSAIFGSPAEVWLALLFGGMMVGFGTQMAGGCTSGHGLSGCAQLVPASLFSTLIFFGSATVLTFLMNALS